MCQALPLTAQSTCSRSPAGFASSTMRRGKGRKAGRLGQCTTHSAALRSLLIKRNGCVVLCSPGAAVTSAPTCYPAPNIPPGTLLLSQKGGEGSAAALLSGASRGARLLHRHTNSSHGPAHIGPPSALPEHFPEIPWCQGEALHKRFQSRGR